APFPQLPLSAYAPGAPQPVEASGLQRAHALRDQDLNDRVDESPRDVRMGCVALLPDQRQYRGLQARKAEVQVSAREHRSRQVVTARSASQRQLGNRGTARITEAEQLGGLVECLARSVVLRFPEQ